MAWLGIVVATGIFPLFTMLLARWFRLPLEEVGFFVGPCLRQWQRRDVLWRINLIPTGSYVKIRQEDFAGASLGRKLAIHLLPHVAIVLLGAASAVIVGGSGMWDPRPFYLGLLQGALHPLSTGPELLRGVDGFFFNQPLVGFFWVIAAIGWTNLLPIPILAMGMAIIEVIGSIRPIPESTRNLVLWLSLLLCFVLFVSWSVALVVWLTGG